MKESNPFLLFMPSYNQGHFIVDAVQSVLAQDDPDWELWIVDNSTDDTPELLSRFSDPRIRFHHIATRMDPGTCLNWMLERAHGRDFSYIHSDNNLRPTYVRRMREALAEHPLALAYCDMRVIDGQGKFRSVYRRGAFDAPRLFSSDTLGVPFAATTALAKDIGGFSVRDYADDVRFCVEAYGIANFVYVPEALMDYRLHGGSRTAAAGGDDQMSKLFTMLMPKVFAALEKRGVQPRVALERAIRQGLEEFDLFVADIWYRKFSHWVRPWWVGEPRFEHFFLAGLLGIPGLSQACQPPKRLRIHDADGRSTVGLPKVLLMRWYLRKRGQTRVLRHLAKRLRNMLVTWAAASISTNTDESVTFRIRSLDFRTLWVACELAAALRWTPLLDTAVKDAPAWLNWGQARGDEPLLDCAFEVSLGREK